MGLRLHPLFTIPAALAMVTVVPLLAARPMSALAMRLSVFASAGAALVLAVIAGLEPAYSKASPQRVNLVYLENGAEPARWIADTSWKGIGTEAIPEQLTKAGPFALDPDAWEGLYSQSAYSARAGAATYPIPRAHVLQSHVSSGERPVELLLHGSTSASGMALFIPKEAGLISAKLRGQELDANGASGDTRIVCLTGDCRNLDVSLVLTNTVDVVIRYAEIRYALPPSGKRLQAARPETAMASQSGDQMILANTAKILAH